MSSEKLSENWLNEQFPQDNELCYLNHAAVSPWPRCTQEAVSKFAQENVVTGAQHYPRWMQTETELRELLLKLINGHSLDEIALAKSTSEALSIIAYGIDWSEGDEILISNQEFPSNRIVWESLSQFGVKVITVDINGSDPIESFANSISSNSRMIAISTVQYASGLRIDCERLSKLCKQNDLLLCLDAIQSLGVVPIDQQKINADFIVADGHKWMMAAEGLALLYVRQKMIHQLSLKQYGWHMLESRGDYDKKEWEPAKDATRFECGSPNMLGIHAMHASLKFLHEIGIETVQLEIEKRVTYLINQLKEIEDLEILSPQDPEKRAGIVTFKLDGVDHASLYKNLMKEQVICAHRGGGIRFSPGFYTPMATIDLGLERLKCEIGKLKTKN